MPPKKGINRVDEETIVKVLEELRKSGFNYSQVEKDTGFHRTTIKRWAYSKRGKELLKGSYLIKTVLPVDPEEDKRVVVDKIKFGQDCFNMKILILQRMEDVVGNCKDIESLARALKLVSEVEVANENNGEIPNILNKTENFVALINKTIINQNIINNQVKLPSDGTKED